MFVNYNVLEDRFKSMMDKYGIKNMDPEILFMVSDSIKTKYINIIKDLIAISRSS